jgi:hypothetical protein
MPWAADVGETGGREALKKWISGGYRDLIPDMQFSIDVCPIADDHYMVAELLHAVGMSALQAGEVGRGRLGQGLEVVGVPVVRLRPVGALAQPVQRVLPDGLQQREPRLAASGLRPGQADSERGYTINLSRPTSTRPTPVCR